MTAYTSEAAHVWTLVTGRIDLAAVLRSFDHARRELATQVIGHTGVFPGFDRLELGQPVDGEGVILVSATVQSVAATTHTVEYRATVMSDSPSSWTHEASGRLVATGVARTLHCPQR